ncbi:MAG TPA: hypothetical protein DDZ05_00035 [Candidatus Blackburnbacteria bacterium]|nr:hypothetical protein [Candidatus Blackburnbacteria bacterium]
MRKKAKGFTLIELMIVISIIGMLAGLSTIGYQGARASSRDARRKADIEDLRTALEIYRSDCGSYPATLPAAGVALVGTSATGTCLTSNTYMSQIPADPQSSKGYLYEYKAGASNRTYTLCSTLENGNSTGSVCGGDASKNCGVANGCRYTAINP